MLNTEFSFKTGQHVLTTSNGKVFGVIVHDSEDGFELFISSSCTKAYAVFGRCNENLPYFSNLAALQYVALGIYLEYGAE